MQRANDMTIAAYKAGLATLREGMTQGDLREQHPGGLPRPRRADVRRSPSASASTRRFRTAASRRRNCRKATSSRSTTAARVDGYQSDITRTVVFGKPTKRQIDVWNLEKRAQTAAFDAAKPGVPCEAVDAAARKVITDAGFGPDYKVPGLPHRTGHGIGLDGHEWTNFVRGNKTPLQPGMCFSDEPMIAIYGEFGIRLEDCLYITESGAKFFTQPSPAIDRPFA